MSGNVKYTRKILSDKSLQDLVELQETLTMRFKGLKIEKVGIYLDDDLKAVYGMYIGSFLLKGMNVEDLIREVEIYERFSVNK